jgi:uncharacterized protein YjiS (DUF1127 family)
MKTNANAGGGTSDVPFYDFVAPTLHAGEGVTTVLSGAFNTLKRFTTAVQRWRWERTTRAALLRLDNATLVDIGVAPSEIPAVARAAAENPTFTGTRRSRWTY